MAIHSGLEDKVVIITGAASGLGRAGALRFAQEGARVAAWDVDENKAKDLKTAIEQAGGKGLFQFVDVSRSESVNKAVDEVVAAWGRVDVLINNAGIVRDSQLVKWKDGQVAAQMADDAFNRVIDVNLRGVFHCTRAVVPEMIRQGGGAIVSTSSVVGLYGNFGQTNYVAAKAGVIGMTKTWARELGKYKIRANVVAPGFIGTEILTSMPPKVLENMVAHTPLGRIGDPKDIAEAYVWLASDAASFVTGAVLSVDGGLVNGT
ncbi:MAG TPA: 3-oxoacyl-ACP reductase FabG [Polyangiaceae bacterium]|jgi:3-oxoacyl-[acyl-carrier protein] reductase|nr:MAG: 3-oxoacyl-(acyl-carrier-protein) reductase FabG [Deltaproteobacteria bacterium ADurb.Bin207]HNS98647.1 3-oxoacyl-ACP reductase FabG [Polyangiaceae bacterium]HNZ21011.1 3-oxoacyl-ACP reductase FabG [Polyangiaceae bacterium]HOE48827.1 3-oxoacyl-ACP reductase FabG [Polyangiaceae bacterium]HOG98881.1 3-oxoacyl-ACP reductase FabG [Polyangiaceae bacterium]